MNFEVNIEGNEVWILRSAGIQMDAYQELFHQVITKKAKLPAVITCPYFLGDAPVSVQLTVPALRHFKIEVADAAVGEKIHAEILRYTANGGATALADEEHTALGARIAGILEPDGVTPQDIQAKKVTLTRRAQEALMRLCAEVRHTERHSVYWHFAVCGIPKPDRMFVARWLLERFAVEKDPAVRNDIETVFINHNDLALPELAEELVRLVKDARYGTSRSGLIYALAKTKCPQAAEVIASVMDQGKLAWSALRSLGSLKAKQHETQLRRYLRDPDFEVRLEAKRALKKIGCAVEQAPPAVHLVKNPKSIPHGLEEWSANLDFENLEPVLKTLAACVDEGFGAQEVAEVVGVAEETRPEQTKSFRFRIKASGQAGELWVVIFMDDIDSPDLEIHADAEVIKKLEAAVDLGR